MIKILMHKDDEVAKLKVDSDNILEEVIEIYNEDLLPEKTNNPYQSLHKWLMLRKMSLRRDDLSPIREFYGSKIFVSDNSRSLFDCYWLKNKKSECWDSINAFKNWIYYNDDIFLMLFQPEDYDGPDDEMINDSPNLTISGTEKRLWYKDKDGITGLIDSDVREQTQMYKKAVENGISIVAERKPIILCKHLFTFIPQKTTEDIESIPFDHLYNTTFDINLSKEANLQKCCETYNIPKWIDFFDELMEFDKILEKNDRELMDIRVLRDSNTLKILGFDTL